MLTKNRYNLQDFSIEEITVTYNEIEVSIMNYGATVTSFKVPNKEGQLENIVLSYKNIEDYINNESFLNAIIGPTSGRIKDGKIIINGKLIELDQNFLGRHNLHGGKECYAYQIFQLEAKEYPDYTEVICSLSIKDQDSYFPGNKVIHISYIIEPNKMTIKFDAMSDQDTYLNLTSHLYFNLTGEKSDITNHYLMIDSNKIMDLDDDFIPYQIIDTKNISLEMATPVQIRNLLTEELISSKTKGIDHPFVLNKNQKIDASLYDPFTKRLLEIKTTYPVIVCYTHNYPLKKYFTNNTINIPYQGVCFETQYAPNSEVFESLENPLLKANERYHHETSYTFSIKKES